MTPSNCWVCGAATRTFWENEAFDAVACAACGHVQADHHPHHQAKDSDYHANYDQGEFVNSLALTRRRQAARLLDALQETSNPRALFDFGCGRGWFLEIAEQRRIERLGGGDVSDIALDLLARRGIRSVKLDADNPLEQLDFAELGFVPEAVTFLDVIEHFPGNLSERFGPWIRPLPSQTRCFVFKVPIREGLLFRLSSLARHAGVSGLGMQLFQAGTHPPHYQYFTRGSLDRFVRSVGLIPVRVIDDIDFEPGALGSRLSPKLGLLRRAAPYAGRALATTIELSARADSRIVIATRMS